MVCVICSLGVLVVVFLTIWYLKLKIKTTASPQVCNGDLEKSQLTIFRENKLFPLKINKTKIYKDTKHHKHEGNSKSILESKDDSFLSFKNCFIN